MENRRIGFIGGGNMASSLIGGLTGDNFPAKQLWVSDPSAEHTSALADRFNVNTTPDNTDLAANVDVIVLAVKPQVLRAVCEEIAESVQKHRPLVISIAAGVRITDICRWLGGTVALIRTMPNTPSLVKCGATALFANQQVNGTQRELAEGIMRAVGLTLWVEDESLLDTVTAISGSGPAYFFLVMEMLENSGTELGLPRETARLLALQTAFGAAKLALESPDDSATLRAKVTSPGGTTERAIAIMEERGIRNLFEEAVSGAKTRATELADILGKDD